MTLQMDCLSFYPKYHPLQQPGCFKMFQSPLIQSKSWSIKCSSSQSSFYLTNQNKTTHNKKGIIISNINHRHKPRHLAPPLALQDDHHASQSEDASAVIRTRFMDVFWKKFDAIYHLTRAYTSVNSIIAITSISLLPLQNLADLNPAFCVGIVKAIVPSILMNIFVASLNQWCDVEIDKINKPYLPLASGEVSMGTGITIAIASAFMSVTLGFMSGSPALYWALIVWFLAGLAYSIPLPFLRWKSHTFMAPFSIVVVMGLLLQISFFIHSQMYLLGKPFAITRPFVFTTIIMSIFAFVNRLLKDLPDVEGDKAFDIKTLCVLLGKEKVLPLCVNLMLIGYGGAIIAGASSSSTTNKLIAIIGHSILAFMMWRRSRKVDVENFESTFGFYMFIWKLNYVEYILIHFLR